MTMIYTMLSGRDCDMVEYVNVRKYKSKKEYDKFIESNIESADGPWNSVVITKDEYEAFKIEYAYGYERDRIMEAYENGKGSSIIV